MRSVKAIRFSYEPIAQTMEILETFRMMVNDAIQISLNENIKGRLNLRNRVYREFRAPYGYTLTIHILWLRWPGQSSRNTTSGIAGRLQRDL
jgi:hypothetical protein